MDYEFRHNEFFESADEQRAEDFTRRVREATYDFDYLTVEEGIASDVFLSGGTVEDAVAEIAALR